MTAALKVLLPGKGEVSLKPTDHLATGGEGAVYLKNNLIFKLYLNPAKAAANGIAEKIRLLSQIRHPFIVAPLDVLLDKQHQLIGYYMPLAEGVPLMKTFTNTWRDQNNFGEAQSIHLVENMREAVSAAHSLNAVMVDANETNYLAQGVEPRVIDVDSWHIGKFPATAIMPSIRDYHASGYNALSDWFAWAVVSFQVFTGIHPYKGTHPEFKKGDLEGRMRANASVFDPKVRVNSAVRDFDRIPLNLRNWYEQVFQGGERSLPPSALASVLPKTAARKAKIRATSSGTVKHDQIYEAQEPIAHVSANGLVYSGQAGSYVVYDLIRKQELAGLSAEDTKKLFANQAALVRAASQYVFVEIKDEKLQGRVIVGRKDPVPGAASTNELPLRASKLVVVGNRIFALNPLSENGLVELDVLELGPRVSLAVKTAWPVMAQSTQFFDGIAAMDCLGSTFLVMPEGNTLTVQKAEPLDGFKLVDGYARQKAYAVFHGMSRKDGQLYRIELKGADRGCELVAMEVVDNADLPLTVTAKGLAVSIPDDGVLHVKNTLGTGSKNVPDNSISRGMALFSLPEGVFYWQGRSVYKLTLA